MISPSAASASLYFLPSRNSSQASISSWTTTLECRVQQRNKNCSAGPICDSRGSTGGGGGGSTTAEEEVPSPSPPTVEAATAVGCISFCGCVCVGSGCAKVCNMYDNRSDSPDTLICVKKTLRSWAMALSICFSATGVSPVTVSTSKFSVTPRPVLLSILIGTGGAATRLFSSSSGFVVEGRGSVLSSPGADDASGADGGSPGTADDEEEDDDEEKDEGIPPPTPLLSFTCCGSSVNSVAEDWSTAMTHWINRRKCVTGGRVDAAEEDDDDDEEDDDDDDDDDEVGDEEGGLNPSTIALARENSPTSSPVEENRHRREAML